MVPTIVNPYCDFPSIDLSNQRAAKDEPRKHRGRQGEMIWQRTLKRGGLVAVSLQDDSFPGVDFRCHYQSGSTPCSEAAAREFVAIHGGEWPHY